MNGRTQYGIVGCTHIDDYLNNNIKNMSDAERQEEDRMKHVRTTNANIEPVFFTYPANKRIDAIVSKLPQRKLSMTL